MIKKLKKVMDTDDRILYMKELLKIDFTHKKKKLNFS